MKEIIINEQENKKQILLIEDGNLVDPESLYKGNYKVQFGLVDGKTGELI